MKNRTFFWGLLFGVVLLSCTDFRKSHYAESAIEMEDSREEETPSDYVSSSAAVENKQDSTRKFIRTADLKFRVKNVVKSTYDIEDIVNRQGGFVTFTNLTSSTDRETTVATSADSSLVTTYYTIINSIELRIPNVKLDTTLKEIARNIDYLDYRIIKAQDVALQILSNNLTQKRIAKNEERLTNAIDNRGKKLYETASAEELLLSKQEQADNAKIANLSLADQISFSTINLSIYQRQGIQREVISADNQRITPYKPSFGTRLLDSLRFGWVILAEVVIFITQLWGLILFGLFIYIVYRVVYRKNKLNGKNRD